MCNLFPTVLIQNKRRNRTDEDLADPGSKTVIKTLVVIIIFIRHEGRNSIQNIKELRTIKLSLKQ